MRGHKFKILVLKLLIIYMFKWHIKFLYLSSGTR
jgi:hypothetical protein